MSLGPSPTTPSSVSMATTEKIPWGIDMTGLLTNVPSGSVSGVSCVLLDLTTGQTVSLADAASVAGNIVTQIVRGSALVAGHNYRLTCTFTAAANTILTAAFEIGCLI